MFLEKLTWIQLRIWEFLYLDIVVMWENIYAYWSDTASDRSMSTCQENLDVYLLIFCCPWGPVGTEETEAN